MKSLLAKNAEVLVTMDDKRRELKNAGLYAVDGVIKQVGPQKSYPRLRTWWWIFLDRSLYPAW